VAVADLPLWSLRLPEPSYTSHATLTGLSETVRLGKSESIIPVALDVTDEVGIKVLVERSTSERGPSTCV
jgi:hypothetical protein